MNYRVTADKDTLCMLSIVFAEARDNAQRCGCPYTAARYDYYHKIIYESLDHVGYFKGE